VLGAPALPPVPGSARPKALLPEPKHPVPGRKPHAKFAINFYPSPPHRRMCRKKRLTNAIRFP